MPSIRWPRPFQRKSQAWVAWLRRSITVVDLDELMIDASGIRCSKMYREEMRTDDCSRREDGMEIANKRYERVRVVAVDSALGEGRQH